MDKKIPIYFDAIILDTPVQELSVSNGSDIGSRLNVAVFTKYKNRNGSYITDEYAEHLINSAIQGDTPVVGFFDPETQSWASHTGPTLANGYGYVERFIGWEPLTDTDGVTRDYAVFSVVIFTKYYEEAKKIRGQYQSMELDARTIEGDWANFDGEEYFVYTKGDMLGFCVIGSHEPCFSVSSFFSKEDEAYKSQYEKFSLLLSGLKTQVKEAEITIKGGEQPVDKFELNEQSAAVEESTVEEQSTTEEVQVEETEQVTVETDVTTEFSAESETSVEENKQVQDVEDKTESSEFENLQSAFENLQNTYNELQNNYNELSNTVASLTTTNNEFAAQIELLTAEKTALENSLANYEAQANEILQEKKNNLIKKYEKVLSAEEIENFRAKINDISYDELESKLAITFANQKLVDTNVEKKVLIQEQKSESQFALLMKNYKKK